ncbi:hypothetical protein PHMEG_00020938 [Phytophthora megakarya]|uniref:Chromo domain-containing protein n=1 Tax=Phytophthora megakarya TaxID=4795 RepID=A0A225VPT2_9STRA|nr:hypothetical protein PHMEG_00020938 [Phytophthora megakarya]
MDWRKARANPDWNKFSARVLYYLNDFVARYTSLGGQVFTHCVTELRASIQGMRRAVADARLKQTLLNKKKGRNDNMVNFSVDDYVLRSRVNEKDRTNTYTVTSAQSYNVLKVKHLVTGTEADVHASRLKLLADRDLEITEELLEHIASQGIVLRVRELIQHRWNNTSRCYEIQGGWHGLEAIKESWEPLSVLHKDVKMLVHGYVATAKRLSWNVISKH